MTTLFKEFRSKFKLTNRTHFIGYKKAFRLFQRIDRLDKPWLEDEDLEPLTEFID